MLRSLLLLALFASLALAVVVRTPSTGFVLRLTSRKGWVLRWLELDFGCDAGDPAEPAGDAPAACLRAFTCPIAGHVAQPGKMINAASVARKRSSRRRATNARHLHCTRIAVNASDP